MRSESDEREQEVRSSRADAAADGSQPSRSRWRRARVWLVLFANLVCGFTLWRTLAPHGSAAAAADVTAPVSAAPVSAAPDTAEIARSADAASFGSGADGAIAHERAPDETLARKRAAEESRARARGEPVGALDETHVARSPSSARGSTLRARDRNLETRLRATVQAWIARAVRDPESKLDEKRVAVAVHVRELGVPRDLVAIRADRAMRPASNMKLVTTAAALCLLGPRWTFDTTFTSAGRIANGRLSGDLVVRAAGDPCYDSDGNGEVAHLFEPAVRALERAGVRAIDGALVFDEGDFDVPAPGPGWPAENQHWEEFCALSGGFSANAGCLTATVRVDDGAARVDVRPRAHGFQRTGKVAVGGAKSRLDVRVGLREGAVVVDGSIPRNVPEWSARFAAPDPVELFARALADAFERHGIAVRDGWTRDRRARSAGERVLATFSTPLDRVLVPINTHSNNACADQLFLAIGHALFSKGTRAGGSLATARALEELSISTAGLVQVDGSGLSRDNRITARQITALIDAVMSKPAETSRAFADSLAVGGETGTLDGRMQDRRLAGRVHAKTGFIGGTSALSGFLDTLDGRTLVFSILVEYPPMEGLNKSCWKPMQDELCTELVESDG